MRTAEAAINSSIYKAYELIPAEMREIEAF
jgi:hypothetical protein